MRKERQETIADIVREMHYCAEKNSAWCCTTVEFEAFTDRIEAAWKREREAGAEAAQICGEIDEVIGREATSEKYSQVGNIAKAREMIGGVE